MDNALELEKLNSVCSGYIKDRNIVKVIEDLTEVFNPKGSLDAINLMRFMLVGNVGLLNDLNNLYINKLHSWCCRCWYCRLYGKNKEMKIITISNNELTFVLSLLENAVNLTVNDDKADNVLFKKTVKVDNLPTAVEAGSNVKQYFNNLREKYFLQNIELIDLSISTFTAGHSVLYPNGKTYLKAEVKHDGYKYESVFELPFNLTKEAMWSLIKDNLTMAESLSVEVERKLRAVKPN